MANHPHHEDDQSKPAPGSGATPKKPAIPNMSLDDDEPFVIEEVVEAEVIPVVEAAPDDEAIPVVEAAPESDIVAAEPFEEPTVLSADDDVVEEIVEAVPASDVLLSEESMPPAQAETPEPHSHLAHPASDVLPGSDAPASEVNLAALFGTAYAPPEPDVAAASAPTAELPVPAPANAPTSHVHDAEEVAEIESASAVVIDSGIEDMVEEAKPASAVVADDVLEDVIEEAEPVSAVLAEEDIVEDVIEEAEPVSAVIADDIIEDVVEEAEPVSAVLVEEDIVEDVIEEVEPVSAVLDVEDVIEEAEPISAVIEAEEFSDVLSAEEVSETAVPSEMKSGELVEEVVEEIEEAEPASAVALDDDDPLAVTEFGEVPPLLKAHDSAVLAEEPARSGSSAVLFDEIGEDSGAKRSSAADDLDKTVAFGVPPSSAVQAEEADSFVTEEDVLGEAEPASAVNLGEPSSTRKPSASGIDEVAEALESGVGLDSNELANTSLPEPSVEFDEILGEDDIKPKAGKKKKAKAVIDDDEVDLAAADVDEDEAAEIFDMDDEPVTKGKNGKAKHKATGDDIDLEDIFNDASSEEAEAVEAFADDDAIPAEAAEADEAEEAFAAVAGAVEDEEEVGSKKKKKTKGKIADDDEAVAAEDEDEEDTSAKKKKGKDKKDKATVASPQAQGSGAGMRWAGRFGLLFLGMFLVIGGILGGLMFAAGDVTPLLFTLSDDATRKQAAESIYKAKAPPPPPKVEERTPLDKLRESLAKGEYDEVTKALPEPADEAEFDLRGQAKWLAYAKAAGNKFDKDAPQIKEAKDDLTKGKNVALIAQIDALASTGDNAAEFAKLKTLEAAVRADKEKSDKLLEGIADVLVKGDYLKDKAMLSAPNVAAVLKSLSAQGTALDALNKVLTDAKYKAGEEGVKSVLKEKTAAEDNIAAINKVLDNEKTKDKGDKGVLEIVDARNKSNTDLLNMTKDRDDLLATVKRAYDELLAGKVVTDDKADPRKELVKGVQKARLNAESPLATPLTQLGMSLGSLATGTSKTVEQTFAMSKVFAELGFYRTREEFIQTPQQKMDTYISLLQDRKQNDAKALAAIINEANWVITPESKSTAGQQAKARYVRALALRNQEKFTEAKAALAETFETPLPKDDWRGWDELALRSQKELNDPNAYYLPRAERLQSEGNLKGAVNEINTGLKAMPGEASLFAQRALIRYEMARGQGAKVSEVLQTGIREDAEAAGKNDAYKAESQYIIGLLEEELGNVSEAEKLFRSAIKTRSENKSSIDDAGKYRIALGRLLLRDRTPVSADPPAEEKKADPKTADKVGAAEREERVIAYHPWTSLALTAVIAQPGEDTDSIEDKAAAARFNETVKLANELIASPNPKVKGQGYLLLGSALSKLGRRTEGLKEYSKGLQLLFPGIQTKEMTKLIEDHPAFQQPDSSGTPNPVMAERHFGEGMHFYWAKQYPEAEKQFRQALRYFDKDARYQYYLGLALIGQRTSAKRDSAIFAFEQGARLEARTVATNPLAVRDINASLERIQGNLRQMLNSYRYKVSAESEETKKGL